MHERLAGVTPGASSMSRKGMSQGSRACFILVHCAKLQHLSHGTLLTGWFSERRVLYTPNKRQGGNKVNARQTLGDVGHVVQRKTRDACVRPLMAVDSRKGDKVGSKKKI